jgi:DNA-binding response OmpR family regulator
MRLLLVEDEASLARHLARGLREEGHAVDVAGLVSEAADRVAAAPYDLVVLDLGLPDGSGLDLLRRWRRQSMVSPVLLLTARDRIEDKVEGLDAGADDYLTKPFAFEELVARVRSLLRRQPAAPACVLECAGLRLDRNQRRLETGGHQVELTTKEFALLEYFMLRPGAVLSRDNLAEHVWDYRYLGHSNVIDVMVGRLRRRLERATGRRYIETVKGLGYALRPTTDEER